jgi:hypothetical protein
MSDEQLGSLQLSHPDFYVHGVCGFDSVDVLSGRPYGGCMIMWHRELDLNFSLLETDSRRVCAMTCTNDQVKILFINVYMPYEEDSNSEDDFCLQLSIMEDLIERYSDCLVICGGDFNVDFSREWRHSTLLNDFCIKMSLHPAFRHGCNAVDYTYNFNMQRFSTIDHFLLCGFFN